VRKEDETYNPGHILVITKRAILLNASGGSDTPPMAEVSPSATSSEI